ncbi:MAG: carboxylesterase family protein [Lachnospiraceae bacterium]|nr:carboxylesterase family protein [Lachnospiraceae bacterium]
MADKKVKKPSRGILWKVLLAIAALILFTVLELGKHTLWGWALAVLAIAAFIFLRVKKLKGKGRGVRLLAWLGLLAVFAVILWISRPPVKAVPAVAGKNGGTTGVIHVAQGDLTGVYTADKAVEVYAGIPYAKPPVGELRWKEPQPAEAWTGTLAADHFAPMSMQVTDSVIFGSLKQIVGYHDYKISLTDNYRPPVSEDSLYLNIWKPAGELKDAPVLVYVHGGSLQTGQPWYEDYSGEGLARDGVIVVNMHYRLGIFGFYADEELAAESPNHTTGNYGLLDQILALEWVRDNIAAFGGDPSNVTISGESAGSACVTALCTSPLAKGLFRRVVAESSTVTAPEPAHSFRLMDEALKAAEKTKERWKASNVADLRAIPAEKLASEMDYHHHITVDGYVLPVTPYEAYRQGAFNEEAQLHGFNGEEAAPFILFSQGNMKNYESRIRRVFGDKYAQQVLELFPASTDAEAKKNWADIDSIILFIYGHICLQRQAALESIPSYVYYFTKTNGRLGDWHSGEEVYLYGNIPEGSRLYDARDRELSGQMKQYFLNFIRTGDPNGTGLPQWEKVETRQSFLHQMPVMGFGDTTGMTVLPENYEALMRIMDEMQGFPIVCFD